MLEPVNDYILLTAAPTESAIALPTTAENSEGLFDVVAISDGKYSEDGQFCPPPKGVGVGSRVFVHPVLGGLLRLPKKLDGNELYAARFRDILGIE